MEKKKTEKFLSGLTEICGNVCKTSLVTGLVAFLVGAVSSYGQDVIEKREKKKFNNNKKK